MVIDVLQSLYSKFYRALSKRIRLSYLHVPNDVGIYVCMYICTIEGKSNESNGSKTRYCRLSVLNRHGSKHMGNCNKPYSCWPKGSEHLKEFKPSEL